MWSSDCWYGRHVDRRVGRRREPRPSCLLPCRSRRCRDAHVPLLRVRHPSRWLRDICGGEAAFPLVVLFGLNAVDELDRTAFGILLPNIRDEFNLDNTKVLGLVALVSIAALALQVPIAQFADRSRRVPLAIAGARGVGAVQRAHRSGHRCDHADHRPQRQRRSARR